AGWLRAAAPLTADRGPLVRGDDARDQRQVIVDLGTPAQDRRPGSFGQPCGDRLQLGPTGLSGGDQVAIELALFVRSAAVLNGASPFLGQASTVAPPDRQRPGQRPCAVPPPPGDPAPTR